MEILADEFDPTEAVVSVASGKVEVVMTNIVEEEGEIKEKD